MTERLRLNDLTPSVAGVDFSSMPVGNSTRTRHGGCKLGNTSVTRTPVGWVMHCFQCGAKGFELARVANHPKGATLYGKKPAHSSLLMSRVTGDNAEACQAALKIGLAQWEWNKFELQHEASRHRVMFPLTAITRSDGGFLFTKKYWAGRAVPHKATDPRKWMVYAENHSDDEALVYYPAASDKVASTYAGDATLVLSEDPISAMRIHMVSSSDFVSMAMLGLHMSSVLLEYAARWPGHVILWTDGDAPGKLRGEAIRRQLEFLRYDRVTMLTYVDGKDPKDLTLPVIRNHLDSVYKEACHRQKGMEEMPSPCT